MRTAARHATRCALAARPLSCSACTAPVVTPATAYIRSVLQGGKGDNLQPDIACEARGGGGFWDRALNPRKRTRSAHGGTRLRSAAKSCTRRRPRTGAKNSAAGDRHVVAATPGSRPGRRPPRSRAAEKKLACMRTARGLRPLPRPAVAPPTAIALRTAAPFFPACRPLGPGHVHAEIARPLRVASQLASSGANIRLHRRLPAIVGDAMRTGPQPIYCRNAGADQMSEDPPRERPRRRLGTTVEKAATESDAGGRE